MTLERADQRKMERSTGKAPVATAALTRSPMMKGTKPLARPCATVMCANGIIQARPRMYTENRDTSAVGATLGGQAGDRGDEEVAEDVAEGGEGPAHVRAGEDRSTRDAEESVRGDGDEASARTEGRTHRESAKRTERDGHGRERQRNRHAGEDDQGDRASGDERDLTNDRAAEAVGEDAVAARSCGGGDGQRGHAMPFDGANGLLFNS